VGTVETATVLSPPVIIAHWLRGVPPEPGLPEKKWERKVVVCGGGVEGAGELCFLKKITKNDAFRTVSSLVASSSPGIFDPGQEMIDILRRRDACYRHLQTNYTLHKYIGPSL